MTKETQKAIDAICSALDSDPSAGPQLIAAVRDGMGINMTELDPERAMSELIRIQRTAGGIAAIVDVVNKMTNVAQGFREQGNEQTAEAFGKFATKLAAMAQKKAEPITKAADRIRAQRRVNSSGGES